MFSFLLAYCVFVLQLKERANRAERFLRKLNLLALYYAVRMIPDFQFYFTDVKRAPKPQERLTRTDEALFKDKLSLL